VGGVIVDTLYPPGAPARVPIIAITGTNGKTTTTRMIGHILASIAQTIGMTTTDGIWIGSACVARGDLTGPRSAQLVLGDPAVTVAVLETARGGIVRGGLGYDWADVAVLTNIQLDHLGQDGITQIEDLVAIKSLVAQRVRAGGTIVLNADDPFAARIGDDLVLCTSRRIVYTSVEAENPRIHDHCAAGGTAYVLAKGWLIELDGRQEQPIIAADAIPASFGGTALFQIANALAATAACRACDVPVAQVAAALRTFYGDSLQNMGRTNLYRLGCGHVLIDYGHNPAAFAAIGRTIAAWGAGRATAVIAVPGDRSDALIAGAGAIAARSFDRLIIREDTDRRGHAEGVVARLLARAVRATVPECPCQIVLDERAAIELALAERRDNETIVVFADQIGMVQELLRQYGAVAADPRTVPLRGQGVAVQLGIDTTV
jgi:cyanophycin synthetase